MTVSVCFFIASPLPSLFNAKDCWRPLVSISENAGNEASVSGIKVRSVRAQPCTVNHHGPMIMIWSYMAFLYLRTSLPRPFTSLRFTNICSKRGRQLPDRRTEGLRRLATMAPHVQDEVQSQSIKDPESFWSHHAEQLYWHKRPSSSLNKTTKKLPSGTSHPHWTWFPDGEISTSYNCVDRHVKNGNGGSTAVIWDSPVTGRKESYTYKQLLSEVETLAGVLRDEGVRKGDVVLIYSMAFAKDFPAIVADLPSAHDTSRPLCPPSHLATRRHPCRRLRRVRPRITGTAYRSIQTPSNHDSLLWDRGRESAYELQTIHRGGGEEEQFQARKGNCMAT